MFQLILWCVELIASHHIDLCSRLLQFFLYCCLLLDERQVSLIMSGATPTQVVAPTILVLVEVIHAVDGTISHPAEALRITIVCGHLCICIG